MGHPTTAAAFRAEKEPATSDWLSGALAGDRAAADRLYAAVRPGLLRTALALGVDPDRSADLVQETLWAAHRNLKRFDPAKASLEGWLRMILLRRARNLRRGRARRRRLTEALRLVPPRDQPGTREAVEARLTLGRLLETLTPRQREVVALYEIAELDAEEVARLLDITPAGVRSVARDARRRLAQEALP